MRVLFDRKARLKIGSCVLKVRSESNLGDNKEVWIDKAAVFVVEGTKQIVTPLLSKEMVTLEEVVVTFEILITGWTSMIIAGGGAMEPRAGRKFLPTELVEEGAGAGEFIIRHGKGIPVDACKRRQ